MPRRVEDIKIHAREKSANPAVRRLPLTLRFEHNLARQRNPSKSGERAKKNGMKILVVGLGSVVLMAGIGYIASSYFSRAEFTFIPKTVSVTVNNTYAAKSALAPGDIPGNTLVYQIMTASDNATTTIPAMDGVATVSKAAGKVVIYNSYGPDPQKLLAGTRFADESKLVYRLTSSVIVPGYKKSATGSITPGSIVAVLVADQPGAEYNVARSALPGDFKAIGYMGTAKYDAFYARLSTDIAGGFSGTKKTTDSAAVAAAVKTLSAQLQTLLATRVKSSIPAGYVLYDNGIINTVSVPMIGGAQPKTAMVTVKGTSYGVVFKIEDLVNRLAGAETAASFKPFTYQAVGIDKLSFSIANPKDFSPANKNLLLFHAKGNIKLVGSVPVEEIRRKLAGATLSETRAILRPYYDAVIDPRSSGEVVPRWANVPVDLKRILITVEGK